MKQSVSVLLVVLFTMSFYLLLGTLSPMNRRARAAHRALMIAMDSPPGTDAEQFELQPGTSRVDDAPFELFPDGAPAFDDAPGEGDRFELFDADDGGESDDQPARPTGVSPVEPVAVDDAPSAQSPAPSTTGISTVGDGIDAQPCGDARPRDVQPRQNPLRDLRPVRRSRREVDEK